MVIHGVWQQCFVEAPPKKNTCQLAMVNFRIFGGSLSHSLLGGGVSNSGGWPRMEWKRSCDCLGFRDHRSNKPKMVMRVEPLKESSLRTRWPTMAH